MAVGSFQPLYILKESLHVFAHRALKVRSEFQITFLTVTSRFIIAEEVGNNGTENCLNMAILIGLIRIFFLLNSV